MIHVPCEKPILGVCCGIKGESIIPVATKLQCYVTYSAGDKT